MNGIFAVFVVPIGKYATLDVKNVELIIIVKKIAKNLKRNRMAFCN